MVLIDGVTRDSRDVRRDRPQACDRALAQALLVEAADGIGQAGELVADDVSATLRTSRTSSPRSPGACRPHRVGREPCRGAADLAAPA